MAPDEEAGRAHGSNRYTPGCRGCKRLDRGGRDEATPRSQKPIDRGSASLDRQAPVHSTQLLPERQRLDSLNLGGNSQKPVFRGDI